MKESRGLFASQIKFCMFGNEKTSSCSNVETLMLMYFTHFPLIIKYGIIFWGSSTNIKNFFCFNKA
jgi:hypothetical protein